MQKSDWKGIVALAAVVLVAFGVIIGTKVITKESKEEGLGKEEAEKVQEISIEGFDAIQKAEKLLEEDGEIDAYRVVVEEAGYAGPIRMEVVFDSDKTQIEEVRILEQQETEGLGSKIADSDFLNSFREMKAPISVVTTQKKSAEETQTQERKVLKDGVYEVKGKEYNGYTDLMSMTITEGKITAIVWDAVDAAGNSKRMLADQGEYVMSEDGLTWTEQADALAKAVVERQGTEFLNLNEEGKTDAVSGVSISIGNFVSLVTECMEQAAGIAPREEEVAMGGSKVDGITGASVSSKAVEKGINDAYEFIKQAI